MHSNPLEPVFDARTTRLGRIALWLLTATAGLVIAALPSTIAGLTWPTVWELAWLPLAAPLMMMGLLISWMFKGPLVVVGLMCAGATVLALVSLLSDGEMRPALSATLIASTINGWSLIHDYVWVVNGLAAGLACIWLTPVVLVRLLEFAQPTELN